MQEHSDHVIYDKIYYNECYEIGDFDTCTLVKLLFISDCASLGFQYKITMRRCLLPVIS